MSNTEATRQFIEKAMMETIKLCDDPTEINMLIVKNNLAIFRQMFLASNETMDKLIKAVDEFSEKSGLNMKETK